MNRIVFVPLLLGLLPATLLAQARVAVIGDSLGDARARYAATTDVPRDDCDPIGGGRWICASFDDPTLADVDTAPVEPELPATPRPPVTPSPVGEACLARDASSLRACLAGSQDTELVADVTLSGCPALSIRDRGGVSLDGDGHTILRTGGHRHCSLFDVADARQVRLTDLVLDDDARVPACDRSDRCPRMVHVRDSANVAFERVEVRNAKGYALYTDGVAGFRFDDGAVRNAGVLGLYLGHADDRTTEALVRGNAFTDNATNALAVLGAKGVLIEGNTFERNHLYGRFAVRSRFGAGMTGGGQLYIARGENVIIRSNTITNGRCLNCVDHGPVFRTGVHGIELSEPGRSDVVANVTIEGNTITDNHAGGVYTNGGARVPGLTLSGNTVSGNGRDLNQRERAQNGSGGPVSSLAPPAPVTPAPVPPSIGIAVVGRDLADAQRRYAAATSQRRADCDPAGDGRWICASFDNPTIDDTRTPSASAPVARPDSEPDAPTPLRDARLVVLHYDLAPDPDDAQAWLMGRYVTRRLDIEPLVLIGTKGENDLPGRFIEGGVDRIRAVFPDALDAHNDPDGAAYALAQAIVEQLRAGGTVAIAEGGPSDATARALRAAQVIDPTLDYKNVQVFQHSQGPAQAFNERYTRPENLAYVQRTGNYVRVANGNVGGNGSADFQASNDEPVCQRFQQSMLQTSEREQWRWAFDRIGTTRRCDGSDTVELLAIVGDDRTRTFDDFVSRYLR